MSATIKAEGRSVVWRMDADEARDLAEAIERAWPRPDEAWRDAEALVKAADKADPLPDPDTPSLFRMLNPRSAP